MAEAAVPLWGKFDGVLYFLGSRDTHKQLRGIELAEERGCPVAQHDFRHRLPL